MHRISLPHMALPVDGACWRRVFPAPVLPAGDGDVELVLHWLEGAGDTTPRVRQALRACAGVVPALTAHHLSAVRVHHAAHRPSTTDVVARVEALEHLRQQYTARVLQLPADPALAMFLRSVNAMLALDVDEAAVLAWLEQVLFTSRPAPTLAALRGLGLDIDAWVVEAARGAITRHTAAACARVWERPLLAPMLEWINTDIVPTLASVSSTPPLPPYHLVHQQLFVLRCHELYDICAAYPSSQPALEDLHRCCETRHQRAQLLLLFAQACHDRLLHSGTSTVHILAMYTKIIRAFLAVDPRGVLLDRVARPIRAYLQDRPDSVGKLVQGMLGRIPELSTLADELDAPPVPSAPSDNTHEWNPDPMDALPDFGTSAHDALALLVLMWPVRLVVDEVVAVFAGELLAATDYNVDAVVAKTAMLRQRFGLQEMSQLDVMIKDIEDSRAIDGQLATGTVHATVVLHLFWPLVEPSELALPAAVAREFGDYAERFHQHKHKRTIRPHPTLGTVQLVLEFRGKETEHRCLPIQAAAISIVAEHTKIRADELVRLLGMGRGEAAAVKKAMQYWVKRGVVGESAGVYSSREADPRRKK